MAKNSIYSRPIRLPESLLKRSPSAVFGHTEFISKLRISDRYISLLAYEKETEEDISASTYTHPSGPQTKCYLGGSYRSGLDHESFHPRLLKVMQAFTVNLMRNCEYGLPCMQSCSGQSLLMTAVFCRIRSVGRSSCRLFYIDSIAAMDAALADIPAAPLVSSSDNLFRPNTERPATMERSSALLTPVYQVFIAAYTWTSNSSLAGVVSLVSEVQTVIRLLQINTCTLVLATLASS